MEAVALTRADAKALASHEKTIERGLATFCEVGAALMAIRDGRLYAEEYPSFAAYCKTRWGFAKRYAYYLIESAATVEALTVHNCAQLPSAESQARPLSSIPVEDRAEVWQQAVDTAPRDDDDKPIITAKHVQQTVEEWVDPTLEPDEPERRYEEASRVVGTLDELAGLKFGCIYADPPWQYGNQATRAATDNHYDTMTIQQLCDMPVAEVAADDAHLHLWTTNAFLQDAFKVMAAWGFEYRSCYVWVKPQMGIGNYWRVSHEFMLLGIRGNAKRFLNHSQPSWGQFDRTKHSAKPEQIRQIIEFCSPGPFLEIFGRTRSPGWTVLGNQVEENLFT